MDSSNSANNNNNNNKQYSQHTFEPVLTWLVKSCYWIYYICKFTIPYFGRSFDAAKFIQLQHWFLFWALVSIVIMFFKFVVFVSQCDNCHVSEYAAINLLQNVIFILYAITILYVYWTVDVTVIDSELVEVFTYFLSACFWLYTISLYKAVGVGIYEGTQKVIAQSKQKAK